MHEKFGVCEIGLCKKDYPAKENVILMSKNVNNLKKRLKKFFLWYKMRLSKKIWGNTNEKK